MYRNIFIESTSENFPKSTGNFG